MTYKEYMSPLLEEWLIKVRSLQSTAQDAKRPTNAVAILESIEKSACAKCPYSAWFVSDWPSEHTLTRPGGYIEKKPYAFCKIRHVVLVDEVVEKCDVLIAVETFNKELQENGKDHQGSKSSVYLANLTRP